MLATSFLLIVAQGQMIDITEQTLDNNGVPLKNVFSNLRTLNNSISSLKTSYLYDSIRAITEINNPTNADAYPWISSDGLRLYYTSGANANGLMFTQRVNTSSYFVSPTLVPISISSPSSYWLSSDELDVYICTSNQLYYAHRNTVSSSFNTPVLITLTGIASSSIKGASLNVAQNILFVIVFSSPATIVELARTSPTSFDFVRNLPIPSGYDAKSGQLSKDELTYFFGVSYTTGNSLLYQLTRTSPTDSFEISTCQQIQGINDTSIINSQPSMSDSLNWVVFVRANANLWTANDLYIAHKGIVTSVFNLDEIKFNISVFPNPVISSFTIQFNKSITDVELNMYNIQGQQVKKIKNISDQSVVIFRENLPSGLYFVRLTKENKTIAIEKLLIVDK